MKKLKIFMLGLLVIALYESCNRNEPTPVPECCYDCSCHYECPDDENFTYPYTDTLYQSDTFKSYWYFPVGSWWEYKRMDTTAEVYDTATIIERDGGIACNCKLLGDRCRERIWVKVKHSNKDIRSSAGGDVFKIDSDLRMNSSRATGHELFGWSYFIEIPIVQTSFYDSTNVKLGDYLFEEAVMFNFEFSSDSSHFSYKRAFVPGVGLVLTQHSHHGSWELIDYHISN